MVVVPITGTTLLSGTDAGVKLVQPVAVFVTKTVYVCGAEPGGMFGPPTPSNVTLSALALVAVNIFAPGVKLGSTAPVYHCCVNGPASCTRFVTVKLALPSATTVGGLFMQLFDPTDAGSSAGNIFALPTTSVYGADLHPVSVFLASTVYGFSFSVVNVIVLATRFVVVVGVKIILIGLFVLASYQV